jgi:hypothetical protein
MIRSIKSFLLVLLAILAMIAISWPVARMLEPIDMSNLKEGSLLDRM